MDGNLANKPVIKLSANLSTFYEMATFEDLRKYDGKAGVSVLRVN